MPLVLLLARVMRQSRFNPYIDPQLIKDCKLHTLGQPMIFEDVRPVGRPSVPGRIQSGPQVGLDSSKPAPSDSGKPALGMSIALGDLVKKSTPRPIAASSSVERKGPAWGGAPLGASPSRLQDIQVAPPTRLDQRCRAPVILRVSLTGL